MIRETNAWNAGTKLKNLNSEKSHCWMLNLKLSKNMVFKNCVKKHETKTHMGKLLLKKVLHLWKWQPRRTNDINTQSKGFTCLPCFTVLCLHNGMFLRFFVLRWSFVSIEDRKPQVLMGVLSPWCRLLTSRRLLSPTKANSTQIGRVPIGGRR